MELQNGWNYLNATIGSRKGGTRGPSLNFYRNVIFSMQMCPDTLNSSLFCTASSTAEWN